MSLRALTLRYLRPEERHVGTYAEDFRETLGLGDGKTIPVVDGIGIAMAAIKSLSKKVKRLERDGLGLAEAA